MKFRSLFNLSVAAVVAALPLAAVAGPTTAFLEPVEFDPAPIRPTLVALPQIVVELQPFASTDSLLAEYGLGFVRSFYESPRHVILQAESVQAVPALIARLRQDGRVATASAVHRSYLQPMSFSANDTYFPILSATVGQWHLNNTATIGLDANVVPAWARAVTGSGVRIGVVDDGVQGTHPDLAPNFDATNSFDFVSGDTNPAPEGSDRHGTSVAGVSAARGGNTIGVSGAAPLAFVAGLRMGFSGVSTSADFANAVRYRSEGANTSLKIKNHSYGYTEPYVMDTLSLDAVRSTSAAGTIHAYAAGNARGTRAQDANKHLILADPNCITVAALGSNGLFASYSNFGSNIFVTAPSSSSGLRGITTTDVLGAGGYNGISGEQDYTNGFGGTSSATPLVVGVLALAKQVNPAADVRVMKHNLARTSRVVNSGDNTNDGGWRTNAAGLRFNANYGFGIIDANALTQAAAIYVQATPRVLRDSGLLATNAAIPDGSGELTRSFTFTGSERVEDVMVDTTISHPDRGDYTVSITSPSGLKVRLAIASASDTSAAIPWTYLANAFWGESIAGTWTIGIADGTAGGAGTLTNWRLRINTGERMAQKTFGGNLQLESYVGDYANHLATISLFSPGATIPEALLSVRPNATGQVTSVAVVRDGVYDVVVKYGTGLARRFANVNMNGVHSFTSLLSTTFLNGDVDDDNEVSILDYLELSNKFGLESSDSGFSIRADLDGDGSISILDYLLLSGNYGLQGQ
jgi:subtilisin family serine protease